MARFAKLFGRGAASPPRVDRIVVGLGNPGEGYAATRHNAGFQVASRLAKRSRAEFALKAADSRIAEGAIDGVRIAIARPQTFMNDSGRAVRKLLDRYRVDPAALLVIFDEVDLPLGKIRLRERGGPGTHNGMRSIVSAIGEDFPRLRVGVAPTDPAAERPALVAPSEDRARRWRAELAGWLGDERVLAFPERETMPFEVSAPSGTAVHQRLLTLWRLASAQAPVAVVTSLRALLEHTIPPEELARRGRTLRAGDRLSWQATAAWLLDLGYEPVTEGSAPGTFSRRGGIIDIYPASAEQPARVELFGDEIETLRAFDPVTQRSQTSLEELIVLPAREFALETAPALAQRLVRAGWDRLSHADGDEGADLSPYARLVDALREGGYAPGVDAFAPALGATASLLDHLGDRATVVFEDTVELDLAHDALEGQAEERRDELAAQGLPVSVLPPPYVPRSRIETLATEHGSAQMGSGPDAVRPGRGGTAS